MCQTLRQHSILTRNSETEDHDNGRHDSHLCHFCVVLSADMTDEVLLTL